MRVHKVRVRNVLLRAHNGGEGSNSNESELHVDGLVMVMGIRGESSD